MTFGPRTPTLLYDGDCRFCRTWVEYWRKRTGETVLYVPFQQAGTQHPEVTREQAKKAVHFIDADGVVTSSAEAVCRLLSHAPNGRWMRWCYDKLPGFRHVSEAAYAVIAGNRGLAMAVTRFLWGRKVEPATYSHARWLYLRGVSALLLVAFISTAPQLSGLVGGAGILPASSFFKAVSENFGAERFWLYPSLAWFGSGDLALQMYAFVGGAAALSALVGVLTFPMLLAAGVAWLSIVVAGQTFFSFQWDVLLVEMSFVAVLLAPWKLRESFPLRSPSWGLRWLAWLLLFRVMWGSGTVKMLSGDTHWRDLTAMAYHYFTQPLPNPLSWALEGLPLGWHRIETLGALVIELAAPFTLLFPRRIRIAGAYGMIALHVLIAATGNFAWYNLAVIVLCLTLLDDQHLRRLLPKRLRESEPDPHASAASRHTMGRVRHASAALGVAALLAANGLMIASAARGTFLPTGVVGKVLAAVSPLRILNPYGAFAVMTTTRQELVIEGSEDGMDWREYEFAYKPGDVHRRPPLVAPHDPRLDWQAWFVPFGEATDSPWFLNLMMRLLQGTPEVTSLFAENPFPRDPPRYVRVNLYEYRFTTREESWVDGAWWHRTFVRTLVPVTSLESMPILYRQAARRK